MFPDGERNAPPSERFSGTKFAPFVAVTVAGGALVVADPAGVADPAAEPALVAAALGAAVVALAEVRPPAGAASPGWVSGPQAASSNNKPAAAPARVM